MAEPKPGVAAWEDAVPKYIYSSITDITPDELRRIGAVAVGIDLDNTTVYDSTLRPREGVMAWIRQTKEAGFPIMIVSNTYPLRARWLSKKFRVPFLALSDKPNPKNVIKAAAQLGVPLENFAMIGDQLFADIEAANRCGAISVWVRPFMREKIFAKKFARRRAREKKFCEEHGIEYEDLP